MRPLPWAFFFFLGSAAGLALLGPDAVHAQQILQYGFEARGPVWKAGSTDTASKVLKHELTEETRHSGQRCEHIQLQVERGTYIHFTYDLPQAPITPELNASLYLKSNRPGIQLLCRIVLPREKDPDNVGRPRTIMVRCEPYDGTRWKLVKLRQPVKRLQEQQQLLAHKLGRDIITDGAYIDQLVLNLYDGPGQTDVWIDDLEIGPVVDARPVARPEPGASPGAAPTSRRTAEVQLRNSQLLVSGKPFLMRGIRYTGTPLKTLRDAGINTIWLDETTPPNVIEDASNLGFWIVPSIRAPTPSAGGGPPSRLTSRASSMPTDTDEFVQKVARFNAYDSVLAWDLGGNLDAESFTRITKFARAFRNADQQQPVIADIWDGYRGYSRSIEQVMLGTHRWPLMTSLELTQYREWLIQRRRLSTDNYSWTWIQTHIPDWFANLAYPGAGKNGFSEAVGPQPEQIRLLAYVALSAGYRGLSFWSDRFLVDSYQGRDRMLAMAVLNQELQILERILAEATGPPEWIATKRPYVMAAVFRTPVGVLVLPIWMGSGSQYVPGQGAFPDLAITVPGVPITATAWEVTPGRIQAFPIKRELGGTTVTIHNFSLTSAVLFTADLSPKGMVVYLQDQQRRVGRLATQWLHDQAQEELNKVERVQAELERLGHTLPDAGAILDKTRQALKLCVQHRRNGEHVAAYGQAETALRALRTLMRAHWDRAVRDLDTPSASPYAVSFFTLPKHWQMLDRMREMKATPTVLPEGGFETPANQVQAGWIVREAPSLDPVTVSVRRAPDFPHSGKQCLMMRVEPRDLKRLPPPVLERTFVSLHSPAVRLTPGTLVRISAWVRTTGISASVDGAQFYDSIGGEPLAVRVAASPAWKRYSLFREVPASGTVSVTLALSGLGTVYFDDVRIEPLAPAGATASGSTAPASNGRPLAGGQASDARRRP